MFKKVTLVIALFAMVFIISCSKQKQDPIRVGALFAVTGPASFLGEPEKIQHR